MHKYIARFGPAKVIPSLELYGSMVTQIRARNLSKVLWFTIEVSVGFHMQFSHDFNFK